MPSNSLTNFRRTLAEAEKIKSGDLPKGLSIQVKDGQDPELLIYDEIGPGWLGMIDGDSVVRALKQLPANHKRVIVRINSPGGGVFEGFSIYNALARHPAEIVVEIDALAASIASLIAMGGDRIRMAANSMQMVHRAWTIAVGNGAELAQTVDLLNKIDENLVATYAARTGLDEKEVAVMLDAETWMTADEAVAKGFADEIGQELQVKASIPADRFKNVPERFKDALTPAVRQRLDLEPELPAAPTVAAAVRQRLAVARRRLGV